MGVGSGRQRLGSFALAGWRVTGIPASKFVGVLLQRPAVLSERIIARAYMLRIYKDTGD